jgi:dTDP-4-amino-4,6-dideoxygalactose transaminase
MQPLALNGGDRAASELSVPEWPEVAPQSLENVRSCLESGAWCRTDDDAEWVDRIEERFATFQDAEFGCAVGNGTLALEVALEACGLQPGEEVIVPGYSFLATASAVVRAGGVPIFADIDPETYNLDPASVAEEITKRTAGVVGVHFAGYPLDFDELLPVVEANDLFLVEDAAHAHGSEWRDRRVGAIGDAGIFSFQQSKPLASGEGGIVLTNDETIAKRVRQLHDFGRRTKRGDYSHHLQGTNYRLSELQGALLCGQLEELPEENERRRRNERRLREELESIDGVSLKPRDDRITARGYCLLNLSYDPAALDGLSRDRFVEALRAEGVPAGSGYGQPIYRQPAFARGRVLEMLPSVSSVPNYHTLHRPGTEAVLQSAISLAHPVLLVEDAGIRSIARAIGKIVERPGEVE